MKNEPTYRTKDLYEAAFLLKSKKQLTELKKEGKFYWFIFEDSNSCRALSIDYWNGNDAKKYADAIRTLKDRIFAEK